MTRNTLWLLALLAILQTVHLPGCKEVPRVAQKPPVLKAEDQTISAAPLASASGEGGFIALTPDECGIEFTNEVTEVSLLKEEANTQSGLASGDYDGDGDLDLFICGIDSPNKLLRNEGGFRFVEATAEAGADLTGAENHASAAYFADLNGDARLDLYVANRRGPNELFWGDGKGGFSLTQGVLDSASATASAALFDADNDGDLDVYLANYRADNNAMPLVIEAAKGTFGGLLPWYGNESKRPDVGKLDADPSQIPPDYQDKYYVDDSGMLRLKPDYDEFYLNDGQGGFTDAAGKAGLKHFGWSYQAQACDFNDDGFTDLYVSSDFETPDRCFMNNGDGTFSERGAEMWRKSPLYGMGVDTGDINGDGLMDLFVADMLSPEYKRAKVQSGDMYQWRWELTNGRPQPQMRNMLFVNRGGGWMSECAQFAGVAASEWTWAVRIADFNCDGQMELFCTNGNLRDSMDVDLKSQLVSKIQAGEQEHSIDAFWLGQPGYFTDDVIFTPKGPLSYDKAPDNWGLHDQAMSCGTSLADYDGDGDLDIITVNTNKPTMAWRNDFSTGARVILDLRLRDGKRSAVGARVWAYCGEQVFAQDSILSRGFATGESGLVQLGLGDHTQIDRLVVRWPDNTAQEYQGLGVNMRYTITQARRAGRWAPEPPAPLFTQAALPFSQQERSTVLADYRAEPLLPVQQSLNGTGLGCADFDADGQLDLYLCGAAGQAGSLLRGDGQGGFAPVSDFGGLLPAEMEEMAALWFDADGDARPDLLITGGGQESDSAEHYGPRLLLNTAQGFRLRELAGSGMSVGAAAAADIDGDADLDLVIGGHLLRHAYGKTAPSLVLANDGQGNFTEALQNLAPGFGQGGQITDLQFADFNGDGRPDLAVAKNWAPVEIWINIDGKLAKSAEPTERGWWQSLGAGDFDGDGDLDLLCGNVGNNTKYHPKSGAPVTTYAYDFDGNGTRDLVEVKYGKEGLALPGRGRSCSGYAIGYIPQKWPTWHSFADASLEDVYGAGLPKAERLEIDQVNSQLLINEGGSFKAANLPLAAQLAPAYGIAVDDFSGDGKLDAFLANNSTAPQCEAGTWNQGYGLLLIGDGACGFSALEPGRSGILIPQCSRSAVAADLNRDGSADLAVSVSNGEAQLALGAPRPAAGLRVVLKGRSPNTAGVGSRLELELSGGARLTRVVQAGQGYLGSYLGPVSFAIPEGEQPAVLTVAWPDGKNSRLTEFKGGAVEAVQPD